MAFLLTLALLLSCFPVFSLQVHAATTASGTCGDNLTWVLDEEGTLTISGTGDMESYTVFIPSGVGTAPWYSEKDNIKKVVIEPGIVNVGAYAFYSCGNMTSVTIPDSVIAIEGYAFNECSGLTEVTIPDSVTTFGEGVFYDCHQLTSVTIPDSVDTIPDRMFKYCYGLTNITIPVSITEFGESAFEACVNLTDVYYNGTKSQWDRISVDIGNKTLIKATVHTLSDPLCKIVFQPVDAEVTAGVKAQFDVTATDAAFYQWQYRRNENTSWFNTTLPGYDASILYVPATLSRNGYQYRCRITGTDGRIIYSEPAMLTVLDSIVITTQPTRQVATSDENATFTVAAEGAGLTYQWLYRKNDEDTWKKTGMVGNETNTLTVPALVSRNGYQYMCAITDENGVKINSKVAVLSTIGFTVDPADQTAAVNTSAVFTATAEGQNLTYQWQYRKSEDGAWMNTSLSGCKTDTLTVLAIASRNGYQYRCRITDELGIIRYSDPATLTVE